MTSDGHRLRETWSNALNDALAAFRTHLTSTQGSSWKRVPLPLRENSSGGDKGKGKARAALRPDSRDISVYRKTTKAGDVYRVILDIPAAEDTIDLEAWKATLVTPELRQEWDPAVESSQILEMYDPSTRIIKTNFMLGWPANPRDAVMISRTFNDATTLVDVSTSLPRSPDEPSYLRPSPPYVRSHVDLFAWCIQILTPESRAKRIRITCFWQHDLRTVWSIGTPVSVPQQLSAMALGLLDTVKSRQSRIPALSAYGFGVSIERISFDIGRAALTVDYAIVPEDHDLSHNDVTLHDVDDLYALKEQRRLQRALELQLPSSDGWDIRIATRASSEAVAQLPWSTSASKYGPSKVSFQVRHTALLDDHSALKVKLVIEFSAALKGIRLNGLPHAFEERVDRELRSFASSAQLLQDASSVANVSLSTANGSVATAESDASASSSLQKPSMLRTNSGTSVVPRGPAFDKSILARVRRNYIYFSSLLQEPEAKWKRNSDVRGVSVTQLDSIDPTLVVYKAEATFVGVGLWDLYSAIVTPGTRAHWDRQYEDAVLIEDVNELTELWHFKTKPAWPVTGRDAVVLKTVYKSPTTVHVFSFSVDDAHLFPNMPNVDMGTIRTQVDLQGWAIEALSPNTTQLTLLEQSDPKGWTGKATVPQQMVSGVAGVGEFAIKCGGPPVVTRLGGARSTSQRYDHERGLFRVEYEPTVSRRPSPIVEAVTIEHKRTNSVDSFQTLGAGRGMITPQKSENSTSASIECELRCDIDTWANSLDIVIDPPPQSISCLRRHRLSAGGGGLWLTVGHDIAFDSEERLHAIVRRAPFTAAKEKGVVMVNGKRINVDVEELPEAEVKSLVKQKRVKPVRIPLDQPPVMGVIRRRRAELGDGEISDSSSDTLPLPRKKRTTDNQVPPSTSSAPKVPSPLSTFFTTAIGQVTTTTQQAVSVFVPPTVSLADVTFPAGKKPVHFALNALAFTQAYHRGAYRNNWTSVADGGISVQKRVSPEISPVVPVHRGEKVIEGVAADEVASAVFSYDCRKQWDDRFDSVSVLEEHGADCHTAFLVSKSGFPFRDRGMLLSSLIAREGKVAIQEASTSGTINAQSPAGISNTIYCVSASFNPESITSFVPAKYNPYNLPAGRIYIDAWIIETLDPYTAENYAIPSTKCTRLAAADFAGSIPVAFNSMINASLPRAVLAVESYMKSASPFPEMRIPAAGFHLAESAVDVGESVWTLHRKTSGSTLVNSKLEVKNKVFTANILVEFEKTSVEPLKPNSPDDSERTSSQITLRPIRAGIPSRPSSPEIVRRPRGESVGSLSPTRHRKSLSTSTEVTSSGALALRSQSRERMRTSSSTFSIGRDQRARGPTDFIVAEVIVDLRTYPSGYEVQLKSLLAAKSTPSQPVQLSCISRNSNIPSLVEDELPITHSVYLFPPSPLYTSGTGIDMPARHLLRLMLPTAQYELPTVEDPLTGETRTAPPKPQWYLDLESKEKRALIQVSVRPLPVEKQKKGKKTVIISGLPVVVGSEKEASKGSVPEESGVSILSRVPLQEGLGVFTLPEQLSAPLAVEDSLFDKSTDVNAIDPSPLTQSKDGKTEGENNTGNDDKSVMNESPGQTTPVEEKQAQIPLEGNRGFLGLMGTYQNSLALLGFSSGPTSSIQKVPKTPGSYPTPAPTPPPGLSEPLRDFEMVGGSVTKSSSSLSAFDVVRSARKPRYSISTLIAAMMIAFLLGSLLRSLLSPADFIYVVTDLGDVPEGVTRAPGGGLGAIEPGWREIKRLVEMKYIVGGWDFQIAVVRRH